MLQKYKNKMDKVLYKPKILIRESKIDKIAQAVGCGRAAVYNAIAYRTNNKNAAYIRSVACNRFGGILVEKYPVLVEE